MSTSTPSLATAPTTNTARLMRRLYFVRAGFAVVWAIVLATTIAIPVLSTLLLVIYPAFDAASALFDARVHHASTRISEQTINVVISVLAVIAVLIVFSRGVSDLLIVFGVWALITGILELVTALRRWRTSSGQAVLVFGGAVSIFAGISFILRAGQPTAGLIGLAGYAVMGSWQFLVSALRLGKQARA